MTTSSAIRKAVIANPMATDHEAAAFFAADEFWDGYDHYWRKLLPNNVFKVLGALFEHRHFRARTWQHGRPPIPSHERLAELSGISVRTVTRILARDADGHHTYTYQNCVYLRVTEASIAAYEAERDRLMSEQPTSKPWPECRWRVGCLVAIKRTLAEQLHLDGCYELGDLIDLFIPKVEPRRRFNEREHRYYRTTNEYHVRPIMPLPPTLEAELAYGIHLAKVRQQREALVAEAATTRAASAAPGASSPPTDHVPCSAKLTEEIPSVSQTQSSQKVTSISSQGASPGEPTEVQTDKNFLGPTAIGSSEKEGDTPLNHQDVSPPNLSIEQDRDRPPAFSRTPREAAGAEAGAAVPLPPRAEQVAEAVAAERKRRAWQDRRTQIDAIIGTDIQRAAALRDDSAPGVTRSVLVNTLASTEIPFDQLAAALRLIEHRFDRVYGAGGKQITTKPIAAWITVARSVIAKGRSWGFDFTAQDEREMREAQLRHDARAAAAAGRTGYIQTAGYYAQVGQTPPPAARPPAPPPRPDAAAELRQQWRPRAGVSRATPKRPTGGGDASSPRPPSSRL